MRKKESTAHRGGGEKAIRAGFRVSGGLSLLVPLVFFSSLSLSFGFFLLLPAAAGPPPPPAEGEAGAPGQGPDHRFREARSILVVLRPGGGEAARYRVRIADDPAERAQGLMGVPTLPAGEGMLFVWPRPTRVGMWMKNTLIPLDMLFADGTGRIVGVLEAVPPCPAEAPQCPVYTLPEPVQLVVELPAGSAARAGIRNHHRLLVVEQAADR